jgi:predicted transcriptional regulator
MEIYDIIDLEKFIDATRTLVYSSFGKDNDKNNSNNTVDTLLNSLTDDEVCEMNACLSLSESLVIAKKFIKTQKNKNTKQIRQIISEEAYMQFVEELNSRLVSNLISKLASQGILETAFDEEANDFVFWVKDPNEKN